MESTAKKLTIKKCKELLENPLEGKMSIQSGSVLFVELQGPYFHNCSDTNRIQCTMKVILLNAIGSETWFFAHSKQKISIFNRNLVILSKQP